MRTVLLLASLICLLTKNGLAQQQGTVDSLVRQLKSAPSDSARCNLLTKISDACSYFDPARGIEYGRQALELAQKTGDPHLLYGTYLALGINYDNQANFSKALEAYFEALKWSEKTGDKRGQAACLSNISSIFSKDNRLEKAEEYLNRAIVINREINNPGYLCINYMNLGSLYQQQHRLAQAREKTREALQLARQIKDFNSEAIALINIGSIYADEQNYQEALEYFTQALTVVQTAHDAYLEAALTVITGALYTAYVQKGTNSTAFPINKTEARQRAFRLLQKGSEECQTLGMLDYQMTAQQNLYELNASAGNYRAAFGHYQQFTALKDSVYSVESKAKIAHLETQRELDIRQKQIEIDRLAVEKKRNERAYFLAGIAALLAVIGVIVRNFLQQRKNNRLLSREKARSDELLLNILPADTAEELKTHGFSQAKRFETVSVLFTDFKNFTRFSESMTPEELVAELDYCFKGFDRIIEQYGLEKIKTIGDAYMAAGGLPQPNDSNSRDAVAAALAMRDFIDTYKAAREAESKPFLEVRIGVHSGPVVAGIVGSKKFAYDLWGDTVNTAARMESAGEAGRVNISSATYERVKDVFQCTYRGKLAVKNKGELDMYFVEGPMTA